MAGTVDFIFLIDGTMSMKTCMEKLKENIDVFLQEMMGGQSVIRDWRGKVVAYRDQTCDGDRWFEDNPFVHNDEDALRAQLAALEPLGGGDEPESLLDALHKITSMEETPKGSTEFDPQRWRYRSDASRVIIVFTDATYKSPMTYEEGEGGTAADIRTALATSKIWICLFAPNDDCYEELAAADKADWEPIPGPDYRDGLREYTSDRHNFQKALVALARTVSKSSETLVA